LIDLGLGGTVEAIPEGGEQLQELGIRVALNSCRGKLWSASLSRPVSTAVGCREPTIKGLDARKVPLPAQVLSIDLAEIGHEEGVLLSGLTVFRIDTLHALAESVSDQLFGCRLDIVVVVAVVASKLVMVVIVMVKAIGVGCL